MWVDAHVDGEYCAQILANSITNCRTSRVWHDPLSRCLSVMPLLLRRSDGRSAALADGVPSALVDGVAILATAKVTHRAIWLVWMSVIAQATAYHDWSITTKFGRQVSVSDPWCKPFWIPYLPYFWCQRENIENFAKPYSSYNSWSSLLIFGHSTLHRHTHRFTSAFLICALMSRWQPFNASILFVWMSVGHATAAARSDSRPR